MTTDNRSGSAPDHAALARCAHWIFDLDNTLYPSDSYLFPQICARITAFVQRRMSLDAEAAYALRRRLYLEHSTTLRGLMIEFDVDPDDYLDYVHDIDVNVLMPNPALDQALAALPGDKVIFTNGTEPHAERILQRLGIRAHFSAIYDVVAANYVPKPDITIYHDMIDQHGIETEGAVMVEDMAVNLAPAADLGITTVLVCEPEDERHDHVDFHVEDLTKWLESLANS